MGRCLKSSRAEIVLWNNHQDVKFALSFALSSPCFLCYFYLLGFSGSLSVYNRSCRRETPMTDRFRISDRRKRCKILTSINIINSSWNETSSSFADNQFFLAGKRLRTVLNTEQLKKAVFSSCKKNTWGQWRWSYTLIHVLTLTGNNRYFRSLYQLCALQ